MPREIAGITPLARIYYGQHEAAPRVVDGVLELPIYMARDESTSFVETWHADGPVTVVTQDSVAVAHDGEYAMCAAYIPRHARGADAVRRAYERSIDLTNELGYANMFRVWNMIGHINETNRDGLEVYRDFCVGRAEAFDSRALSSSVPSATGIGSRGDGVSFFFLATRTGTVSNLENPHQMPAAKYPPDYGPRSPSFARASTVNGTDTLYFSGTASILGHQTVHVGDLQGQLDTTRANIDALLRATCDNERRWNLEHVKVFVRRARDLDVVQNFVEEHLPTSTPPAYFNVAICRSDLLVEIEGIARR